MLDIELERSAEERESAKEKQLEAEFGQTLQLEFVLPNGTACSKQFRTGHSIQYVKAVLHHDEDLPMAMVLNCGGKKLIDPLSIADCSSIVPGQKNVVTVQVQS